MSEWLIGLGSGALSGMVVLLLRAGRWRPRQPPDDNLRHCGRCGVLNPRHARFCPRCGLSQPLPPGFSTLRQSQAYNQTVTYRGKLYQSYTNLAAVNFGFSGTNAFSGTNTLHLRD